MRRLGGLALFLLLPSGIGGQPLVGQANELPTRVSRRLVPPASVPFGPGEILEYKVKLGPFGVGSGQMSVISLDSVRGHLTYHASLAISGGVPLFGVDDEFQSWFDVRSLASRRFIQDVDEGSYERYRHYEIFPEERRFERRDKIGGGDIPSSLPLDDVSFLYFVRALPLNVGDEYSFDRYFREGGNPVVIKVLRKDTVNVPAGTFETVVVQPIIQTKGLFSQGGEAELHFSDDPRRLLVYLRSKVPLVGSITLHLRGITEGTPLRSPGVGSGEELQPLLLPPGSTRVPPGSTGGEPGSNPTVPDRGP
ncbi:DUF3108 domain-containing protein [Gemmatimonadota bacterium]